MDVEYVRIRSTLTVTCYPTLHSDLFSFFCRFSRFFRKNLASFGPDSIPYEDIFTIIRHRTCLLSTTFYSDPFSYDFFTRIFHRIFLPPIFAPASRTYVAVANELRKYLDVVYYEQKLCTYLVHLSLNQIVTSLNINYQD